MGHWEFRMAEWPNGRMAEWPNWALGMGHGALGMGHWAWGIGHWAEGHGALGMGEKSLKTVIFMEKYAENIYFENFWSLEINANSIRSK